MRICVFGLGQAGALFARDLALAGAEVNAYDPAPVPTPSGVRRLAHPALAVHGAELVLSLTAEADALLALVQSIEAFGPETLYADLSTSSPVVKAELEQTASLREVAFVDVALMDVVPGNGLATPSLVAGKHAERYVAAIVGLGGKVEAIAGAAGTAAGRKLLRGVVMQGMAAVIGEAVQAGAAAGDLTWLWSDLVNEVENADAEWLRAMLDGNQLNSAQRVQEMRSAERLLGHLGVTPTMTTATAATLAANSEVNLPEMPKP